MPRLKELRRIESAIKNKDVKELFWAIDYCKTRQQTANKMGLRPAMAKSQTKHWQTILDRVEDALSECNDKK